MLLLLLFDLFVRQTARINTQDDTQDWHHPLLLFDTFVRENCAIVGKCAGSALEVPRSRKKSRSVMRYD